MESKMKIEIWSDIMCPFCYIGKRMFEKALNQFSYKEKIQVEWKAFQLNPNIPQIVQKENIFEYFAKEKGVSYKQSEEMHERMSAKANEAGLKYNFDRVIVANTLNAHRLSHLGLLKGAEVQDRIEELLFKAYFTEGKNINDFAVLTEIGVDAGLKKEEVLAMLQSDNLLYEVKQDIQEAANIGISGVPFFLFNRKLAVSGAQPPEEFLKVLEKSYDTWKAENKTNIEIIEGENCSIDGNCN